MIGIALLVFPKRALGRHGRGVAFLVRVFDANVDKQSDAYATGQALYVLSACGMKHDRPEVQRGAAFLVRSQKDDGGWPMTPRSHPEATPANNAVPITYFGSAWGTIGLIRSTPPTAPSGGAHR